MHKVKGSSSASTAADAVDRHAAQAYKQGSNIQQQQQRHSKAASNAAAAKQPWRATKRNAA
jgi:hypothetical protein